MTLNGRTQDKEKRFYPKLKLVHRVPYIPPEAAHSINRTTTEKAKGLIVSKWSLWEHGQQGLLG